MKKSILTLAAAACLLCSCGSRTGGSATTHTVMTVQPENLTGDQLKHFSGIVKESEEIGVGFKAAGQISAIYVKEGDYVRQGQVLARLDDKDYRLGVESSEAQYNQMKNQLARMKKLLEGRSLTKNDYEKTETALKQLEVQLKSDRNKLSYTTLTAPQSGYIQAVNFRKAEMVNAGTPVFTLLNVRDLEVEISLPTSVYTQKARFKKFTGKLSVDTLQVLPLKLVSITPKADANQLYKATFVIDDKNVKNISSGMNVEVDIEIDGQGQAATYALPMHAVFEDGGKAYVWVVGADNTVKRREVTVDGTSEEGKAVVSTGLQGDEQVVKAGVTQLQEGEKVTVVDKASDTNVGGVI